MDKSLIVTTPKGSQVEVVMVGGDFPEHVRLEAMVQGKMQSLLAQRRNLAAQITGVLDETEVAREKAFERDMGGIPSYDNADYRRAVAELKAFDAAHPEVVNEIEKERKESIERHMWD